jgi:hypothetical protein
VAKTLPERALSYDAFERKLGRLGKSAGAFIQATAVQGAKDDRAAEIAAFVQVAKKGAELEELCDRLDASPKKVRNLLEEAKKRGYSLDIAGDGRVGYVPPKPLQGEKRIVAQPGEEHVFAVASDIHIGSKFFLRDQFVDFVTRAYHEDGVRTIFVPGDILDGCYRHSKWDESHHGFHDQAREAVRVFPQLPGRHQRRISARPGFPHSHREFPNPGVNGVTILLHQRHTAILKRHDDHEIRPIDDAIQTVGAVGIQKPIFANPQPAIFIGNPAGKNPVRTGHGTPQQTVRS